MVNPESFLITNEYVRQALDQLVQNASNDLVNPLQFLQLVDAYLLTADFTFFQHPRQFALGELLIGVIRKQYESQRWVYGLPTIRSEVNLMDATEVIKEDAATTNPDLIGWSWLYFHYVEINLHMSQQKFCEIVNLDDRTIRRYQNNTIDQMTKHLIRMEQETREIRRVHLLYLQLPHQGEVSDLLERERELELLKSSQSKHFQIVGALGIGKSVFVEYFLQHMITDDELDRIVWLQSPENVEDVLSYLNEQLLIENSTITIREYCSLKRVAVVIDDSDYLHNDLPKLQNFLQELSGAYIFLTCHIFKPLLSCFQIHLRELSLLATKKLLSDLNPDYKEYFEFVDFGKSVWQSIGGNPFAIKLLAQNWSVLDIQSATFMTLDKIFSGVYDVLSSSERMAWLLLALLNHSTSSLMDLTDIVSPFVNINDFIALSRLHITETSNRNASNISLTHSAHRYIQYCYENSSELQNIFSAFWEFVIRDADRLSPLILTLVENTLSVSWIKISPDNFLEAANSFWEKGVLNGHYTKWHSILSKYATQLQSDTLDLVLGYGICQRYLGRWSQADSIFTSIIEYAGHHGDFLRQARALIELAILFRYQGDYRRTVDALNHIYMLPDARLDIRTVNRATIEHIELELERDNLVSAEAYLRHLPDNEPRKNILQIEIYTRQLAVVDTEIIGLLGDKLFSDFSYSSSISARIHTLIGRLWEKNSDFASAIKHHSIALSLLLEQDNDPFALARVQSNLASLFIRNKRLTEARELLNLAQHIQRQIGDRVGLAATIHNQHVIDRKIVN